MKALQFIVPFIHSSPCAFPTQPRTRRAHLQPIREHVVCCRDRKAHEKKDEDSGLKAVCRDAIGREEDGAHEAPLGGLEASAEDHSQAGTIGGPEGGRE
jgi:hypothetical protein